MKHIYNKILPPPGFKALTLWPLLFIRSMYMMAKDIRHEYIHGRQQREMLVVGILLFIVFSVLGLHQLAVLSIPLYFWLYGAFWLYHFIKTRDLKMAYRQNPFEKEAYFFEGDGDYLNRRKWFAWTKFIKQ